MMQKNTSANLNVEDNAKQRSLSVFMPCYNEAANVERVAADAVKVLDGLGIDYELILINDGSKDDTGKIADKIAAGKPSVKVVHHPHNLGYGAALQSGFKAAGKELVFYTDGDGQFDMRQMPQLLPLIEKYDIVSCYRQNRQDNWIRKLNAWCWTKLVCFLFRMKIRDIDCAFKLYKREIFNNIKMTSTGALIDTEILARAARKGYTITQRPVKHLPRRAGTQTGANFKVIFRAFKELFKLYGQIRRED